MGICWNNWPSCLVLYASLCFKCDEFLLRVLELIARYELIFVMININGKFFFFDSWKVLVVTFLNEIPGGPIGESHMTPLNATASNLS